MTTRSKLTQFSDMGVISSTPVSVAWCENYFNEAGKYHPTRMENPLGGDIDTSTARKFYRGAIFSKIDRFFRAGTYGSHRLNVNL